jgi:hypothetical protein
MSVERFFLEGYRNEEHYQELVASDAFPLVRDLEFKYGLKVIRRTSMATSMGYRVIAWLLGYSNGIAVGKAYTDKTSATAASSPVTEYCFRTPFYSKERGRSREDKQTLRSVKVSSLMAALSRQHVIPPVKDMIDRKAKQVSSAQEVLRRVLGSSSKTHELSPDEVHAVLLMALGRSPSSSWSNVTQNKCQEVLDKYEEADRLRRVKQEEAQRIFYSPYWMIGIDEFGDYLIGKFKLSKTVILDTCTYEVIEPFKRYPSYQDVPELVPLMTMVKIAYENETRKVGIVPVTDKYDSGLDAVFCYNQQPTHYDHVWMVTPCST